MEEEEILKLAQRMEAEWNAFLVRLNLSTTQEHLMLLVAMSEYQKSLADELKRVGVVPALIQEVCSRHVPTVGPPEAQSMKDPKTIVVNGKRRTQAQLVATGAAAARTLRCCGHGHDKLPYSASVGIEVAIALKIPEDAGSEYQRVKQLADAYLTAKASSASNWQSIEADFFAGYRQLDKDILEGIRKEYSVLCDE